MEINYLELLYNLFYAHSYHYAVWEKTLYNKLFDATMHLNSLVCHCTKQTISSSTRSFSGVSFKGKECKYYEVKQGFEFLEL